MRESVTVGGKLQIIPLKTRSKIKKLSICMSGALTLANRSIRWRPLRIGVN